MRNRIIEAVSPDRPIQFAIEFIKSILATDDKDQIQQLKENIDVNLGIGFKPTPPHVIDECMCFFEDYNIYILAITQCYNELLDILENNNLISDELHNRKTIHGNFPLMLAVLAKNYDFVESELIKGANPNAQNEVKKFNLLDAASLINDPLMVELLLDYKASPNSLNNPIYYSLLGTGEHNQVEQEKVISLLIDRGVNILETIGFEKTPLDLFAVMHLQRLYTLRDDNKTYQLINNEITARNQFKKNASLLFWASKNDENSSVHGVPEDCFTHMARKINHG